MTAKQAGLREYRAKRHFEKTPEPKGVRSPSRGKLKFCIQKHDATRLHYDFRLELDGVLKSWAVPKGPSLDPSVRRLAMHVEDHPLDYRTFEGVIPEGEYGAGPVLLWDEGTWEPEGLPPDQQYKKGHLRFSLKGKKLSGGWTLVRTSRGTPGKEEWLLIKRKDEEARTGADIVDEEPLSVKSGKSIEEIGAKRRRSKPAPKSEPAKKSKAQKKSKVPGKPGEMPLWVAPELATLVKQPPAGEGWIHEIKFDGYRILSYIDSGEIRLFSRNRKSWDKEFPEVADALSRIQVDSAIVDGEVVMLDEAGRSRFQLLQDVSKRGAGLRYQVFDLMYLHGHDLRDVPLSQRKELLAELIGEASGIVVFSEHFSTSGAEFFKKACELGLEGIISKRADSKYISGRGREWLKIKCEARDEFVIGGFTPQKGSKSEIGALLLGETRQGTIHYAGKVGTGFSTAKRRELFALLKRNSRAKSPFADSPRMRDAIWTEPQHLAEVRYSERTSDGKLRHPSFVGLREDLNVNKPVKSKRGVKGEEAAGIEGVTLTNPDRVLYPEQGLTKAELARYYEIAWTHMAPYVTGRPLVLVRCPEGQKGECFYQKHANVSVPSFVPRVMVQEKSNKREYAMVESLRDLIGLVQISSLEIHGWGAPSADTDHPDLMIVDLDPDEAVNPPTVREAVFLVRAVLEETGLQSFLRATGGKGYHVVVPLSKKNDWDEVRGFSQAVAGHVVKLEPSLFIAKSTKAKRAGKIYVDYLRNAPGSTAIVSFSTRAKARAPISHPLLWDDLKRGAPPDGVTAKDVINKRIRLRDPWRDYFKLRQNITKSMQQKLG